VLQDQKKSAEAVDLLQELTERLTEKFGERHDHTLRAVENLAITLDRDGRPEKAEALFTQVLAIYGQVFGETHDRTLRAMHNLAIFYEKAGNAAGMEELNRCIFEARRETQGPEDLDTLKAMNNLARSMVLQKSFSEGEALYREGLKILGGKNPDHGLVAAMHLSLGDCLIQVKRYEEAKEHLLEGYKRFLDLFGKDHWRTRGALDFIIRLYDEWGKPKERDRWQGMRTKERSRKNG
jgi:tetratricopeptide (TPR) repeat protein